MLAEAREEIERRVSTADSVLDVGGWADPLERADVVLDLMPYESRGLYERMGWIPERDRGPERFSSATWITRDLCDREPWPFEDAQFDFVVCAHTLEDVRDPLWVCAELQRVARRGYIEVPSRLEEQSFGVAGDFVGWAHHRWLIDVTGDGLQFVLKTHDIGQHPDCFFPREFWAALEDEERVQSLWWEGSFEYSERIFIEEDPHERYLPELVRGELARRPAAPRGSGLSRLLRRAGS